MPEPQELALLPPSLPSPTGATHAERVAAAPSGDALRPLVEAARDGDVDAFRRLFEEFYPRLFRYAALRLGDRASAEDVVQGIFVVVWRRLVDFRYERDASFAAWLFAIGRRVVADQLRRGRGVVHVPLHEMGAEADPGAGPEDTVVAGSVVLERLSGLPDSQREVLVLRFLVGLTPHEVAASLGKSEARVRELQHRGLSRLRAAGARGRAP